MNFRTSTNVLMPPLSSLTPHDPTILLTRSNKTVLSLPNFLCPFLPPLLALAMAFLNFSLSSSFSALSLMARSRAARRSSASRFARCAARCSFANGMIFARRLWWMPERWEAGVVSDEGSGSCLWCVSGFDCGVSSTSSFSDADAEIASSSSAAGVVVEGLAGCDWSCSWAFCFA